MPRTGSLMLEASGRAQRSLHSELCLEAKASSLPSVCHGR